MKGIKFNNKHSYDDFGFYVESKVIQSPAKKKIKIDVPGMSGNYDFSTVNSNGEITYDTREITINFGIKATDKQNLYFNYSQFLAWLIDAPQSQLILDDIADYYFLAEVEVATTLEQVAKFGKIAIKFIADPFMTSIDNVGDDIWDTFNFLEDVTQDNTFNVVNSATISIYNVGRLITPIINCSTIMSITVGGKIYNLAIGDNKLYGLKLKNGYNSIVITGTGKIKFIFKKVKL